MTTFQVILSSILDTICHFLPLARGYAHDFSQFFLGWGEVAPDFLLLITFLSLLTSVFFYRYDVLGFISALIKSIIQPQSLKATLRTLDQQVLVFILITVIPVTIIKLLILLQLFELPHDLLTHPYSKAGAGFVTAIALFAGPYFNKRLRGLNHLKLNDAFVISALLLTTIHPAISTLAVLWFAFSILHYHYEAIFKYTNLIVILLAVFECTLFWPDQQIVQSFQNLGWMNAIVFTLITISTAWITLENLKPTFSESTFRMFKWLQSLIIVGYCLIGWKS